MKQVEEKNESLTFEQNLRANQYYSYYPNSQVTVITKSEFMERNSKAQEILKRNGSNQDTVDQLIHQNKTGKQSKMVITSYMKSQEFQMLRYYWLRLPDCIQHCLMNGGEFVFSNIGNPDDFLLEEFQKYGQYYVDTYFPEYNFKVTILTPSYYDPKITTRNIYKKVGEYRLSIQSMQKTK